MLNILLSSAGYAERHGAAHGLAGLVRGAGILSLRQYGIIDRLMSALEDKQRATYRESEWAQ
ncbi:unnamed protein product [Protopolystoma xenopodis]|uniref:Uncharacterized protein n=1 Tax=Protopolystoma xenopodis TaxID=117903 RepID=A0A3S5CVZ9_9PLAT|nr:unnamed protein product [Protopolystoma xenopodis]